MNLNMNSNKIKSFLVLLGLLLTSCGSSEIKPTTDLCMVKKHWKDNVFQVLINDKAINQHWYIHDEAMEITKQLAKDNKCMR